MPSALPPTLLHTHSSSKHNHSLFPWPLIATIHWHSPPVPFTQTSALLFCLCVPANHHHHHHSLTHTAPLHLFRPILSDCLDWGRDNAPRYKQLTQPLLIYTRFCCQGGDSVLFLIFFMFKTALRLLVACERNNWFRIWGNATLQILCLISHVWACYQEKLQFPSFSLQLQGFSFIVARDKNRNWQEKN